MDPIVRVLLVDDQERNLEALEAVLEATGCRLVRARSADEALLALLDDEFAAIVLDIKMPGMNGIDLAQLIRARRRTRHVPILFLTAHLFDEKDVLRGYNAGGVDYLTKPLNPVILRAKVAVFVELFRKSQELAVANDALQREIAEREKAEEALREVNQQLEARVEARTAEVLQAHEVLKDADRRKNDFLATLAHELRNPLAPIRNAVQVLVMKGPAHPDLQWARELIARQTQHLTRLVDDLLDISRITRDRLELRREPVELSRIVQMAVETSRPWIDEGGHELTITLPDDPTTLNADLTRLAQVISNLLNNAAKYSDRGGRIALDASRDKGDVVIRVTDTGVGIPEAMVPRVFEMFVQDDRSPERVGSGLGVGLALAKRLVEMHSGTISVRSGGPGHGSEFTVRLPVKVWLQPTPTEAEVVSPMASALRILVVDDNRDSVESLGVLLRMMGNDIRSAADGMEAIRVAEEFRPDVVLLDIGLPRMNGYETARVLRDQPWGQQVVLIALTGWGQEADRRESLKAGFDHHLVKPVDPGVLMKLLVDLSATQASLGEVAPVLRPVAEWEGERRGMEATG